MRGTRCPTCKTPNELQPDCAYEELRGAYKNDLLFLLQMHKNNNATKALIVIYLEGQLHRIQAQEQGG